MNQFRTIESFIHLAVSLALLTPLALQAQLTETFRSWNQPVAPFRIVGNVYYVGASDIASYLITTPEGHSVREGGFVETAPVIQKSIREQRTARQLRFNQLCCHAGARAAMKEMLL